MPTPRSTFTRLYRQLNPAQRQAVDTIEGPVMVVAGPGTGKTQILTLRIANILRRTDTAPDSILALTFTKSGVHSMRERLVGIIGSAGYRVNINTFHGFCNEIINQYPEAFPRLISATNATVTDQIKILESLIETLPLQLLRPFGDPFYHLYPILGEIEKLKKENLSPTDFKRLIEKQATEFARLPDLYHRQGAHRSKLRGKYVDLQKEIAKNQELVIIYEAYEQALRQRQLYDFSDMIMEVIRALEQNQEFLWRLQEQYQYLLADEHQDANQSQNRLLELLANFYPDPNLFIVGDEKQAIFQFQGASLDNFNYFKKLYPRAKLIALTENYRSSQTILDAAQSLIQQSQLPATVLTPLRARPRRASPRLRVVALPTTATESQWLAADIAAAIAGGAVADEIAVLYRDNHDAGPLAAALGAAGVPVVIQSDTNVLDDFWIEKLLIVFRAIHHFGDDYYLARLLPLDLFDYDPLVIYRFLSTTKSGGLYPALRRQATLAPLYQQLVRWQRLSHNRHLVEWFGVVLEESGFLARVLAEPLAVEILAKVQTLYEEIKTQAARRPHYRLADLIDYLTLVERHHLSLPQQQTPAQAGVRLLTAHRSKGREFDRVYLVNAVDGHWGNRRRGGGFRIPWRGLPVGTADQDDERRLFYVALTRARQAVTITYARADAAGRQYLPSQFVAELTPTLLETQEVTPAPPTSADFKGAWRASQGPAIGLANLDYLNQLFTARGLSATALNNYLACPLKYFFQNLLRLTQAQNRHLLYGTVMHATLKHFFDRYREEADLDLPATLQYFERQLAAQPFSPADLVAARAQGARALTGYLGAYAGTWPRTIINEFAIRGVSLAPDLRLTGKLDKVELLNDRGEVRVVDYKTGRPKSRNEVLGLTKTSDGNYRRQLVFYRLMLDHYADAKYRATFGLIDFVEPDERGRFSQVELALEPAEVAALGETVRRVAGEIRSGRFLTQGCGQADCESCRLWALSGARRGA